MVTHSNGISALQLQKQIRLGSYKAVLLWCVKAYCVILALNCELLTSLVEGNETEIPYCSKHNPLIASGWRSHQDRLLVAAAVKVQHGAVGLIRLAAISDFLGQESAHQHCSQYRHEHRWLIRLYPGISNIIHDRHVITKMAGLGILPWVGRRFPNLDITAYAVSTSKPTLTSSCSAPTAANPVTPFSTPRSASNSPLLQPPNTMLILYAFRLNASIIVGPNWPEHVVHDRSDLPGGVLLDAQG